MMSRFVPLLSCLLAFAVQGFTLWQPSLITDDISQHHVWLDGGTSAGLQPGDPWVGASKIIQPYVVAWVTQAVRFFLPTLLVGKAIALVMLALTGVLIYHIAASLRGSRAGWVALGLFFVSDAWIGISGGFARSFAWALVCGCLLALLKNRQGLAALSLFLAAALYPILFVLLCPVYAMVWLAGQAREGWQHTLDLRRQLKAQLPLIVAVAAGCTLVLLKSREIGLSPLVGPSVTLAEMEGSPLYKPGGRVPLLPQTPLYAALPWSLMPWNKAVSEPVLRHAATLSANVGSLATWAVDGVAVLGFVLAMVILWRRSREKALVLLALAGASMATYLLAQVFVPRLFEPSRYVCWSMPVLAVLGWAVLLDVLVGRLPAGRPRQVACVCLALLLAVRVPAIRGKGAEDVSEYAALYLALTKTGGEEMVACFPRTGDFIPVLSHRSVFASHESSFGVIFTHYRDRILERNAALLKALYAAGQQDVKDFCVQNNVNWLVIEEKYYRPDVPAGVHFAPFEQQFRDMLKQTPEPWVLTYARKAGKQVQPGVYLVHAGPIIDSPQP